MLHKTILAEFGALKYSRCIIAAFHTKLSECKRMVGGSQVGFLIPLLGPVGGIGASHSIK